MTTPTPIQVFATIFRQPLRHGQLMLRSRIRRSGRTLTDWCYSLKQAARQVELYRKSREVFFGVALHDRQKALTRARQRNYRATPARVRGSEESVTALPALWAEIGVADPAGADRPAALARIDAMSPPPSIVVGTGTAYQALWLLDEPWVLKTEDDQRRAKRLLGKVQGALTGSAEAGGCGLAGLMQVAGTFHHFANRRFPVVLERYPGDEAECRWARRDFEQLEDPPERPAAYPWPVGGDLRPVWEGCSWLRHCYHRQATLHEAEWTAALSVVGRCQAADDAGLARSFSHRHPGYLPEHTARQLERALSGTSGPATCRRIGGALGAWDGHCSQCPHQGRIASPIELRQADADAPAAVEAVADPPAPRSAEDAAPESAAVDEARKPAGVAMGPRLDGPSALEIEVVFRISPGADSPAAWAPLLEAAIGCLAVQGPGGGAETAPVPELDRSAVTPRQLLDGLEEVVSALGRPATAQRIVETLAAEEHRERFGPLRSALRRLFPDLEGALPTSSQLGYALRAYGRAPAGARQIAAAGKNCRGVTWEVRRTSAP